MVFIKSCKKEKLIQRLVEVNLTIKHSSGKLTKRCWGKGNVRKKLKKARSKKI